MSRPRRRPTAARTRPFLVVEQLVAPVGDRPQVPLVRALNSCVVSQHVEVVGEALENLVESHVAGSTGGELQAERQPIESFADLCDHVVPTSSSTMSPAIRCSKSDHGGSELEWTDGEQQLPSDSEALAAGGDDPELGTLAEQFLDERIDDPGEVLAVVEHHHGGAIADDRGDVGEPVLAGVAVARRFELECSLDRGEHVSTVASRSQVHPPDAAG